MRPGFKASSLGLHHAIPKPANEAVAEDEVGLDAHIQNDKSQN